jgi:hypothetical protein
MTHLNAIFITEDVRILEVDGLVLQWISGIKKSLSLTVEFDRIGWFIDSVCFQ